MRRRIRVMLSGAFFLKVFQTKGAYYQLLTSSAYNAALVKSLTRKYVKKKKIHIICRLRQPARHINFKRALHVE